MNNRTVLKAERETVFLSDGQRIFDLSGGFGYQVPEVRDAVVCQVENKVGLSSRVLISTPLLELCETLSDWLGPNYENSYVCNSGDEAFEGALKLARAKNPERKTVVFVAGTNYGRMSYGRLSSSATTAHELEQYLGVKVVRLSSYEELDRFDEWGDCFAFCHGPFLKDGNRPRALINSERMVNYQRAASKYGVVSIYSDIDTCLGHLGHKRSHEHYGGCPDVIVMGSSLDGGMIPIGTYTTSHSIANTAYGSSSPAKHGSTTAGNPPACVSALAALRFAQDQQIWNNATANGIVLADILSEFKPNRLGGWVSLIFESEAAARNVHQLLNTEGINLSLPDGNELTFRPPLTARKKVIAELSNAIVEILKNEYKKVA